MRPSVCFRVVAACVVAGVGVWVPACGDDSVAADDDNDGAAEAEDGDENDGADEAPVDDSYAVRQGIRLTRVSANQGVEVNLNVNGSYIPGSARNAPLFDGRNLLIRGFWELDEGWEPRPVTGRLTLRRPDGSELVMERTLEVSGDSNPARLQDGAFFFGISADDVTAGMSYRLELLEAAPGREDENPSSASQVPSGDEFEAIGVQEEFLEMKVTMVPVDYTNNTGSCVTNTAELSPEVWDTYRRQLMELNPAQRVKMTIREEPLVYSQTIGGLSQLFTPLREARIADKADANEYYYAIIDPCAGGVGGAAGIAPGGGVPPLPEAEMSRISVGIHRGAGSVNTFVHEVGHNQSLSHIYCPGGGAAGPDTSYPDSTGRIIAWGFGIESFTLHSPSVSFDYMSYCGPRWTSDWTWVKNYFTIRALSSWERATPNGREAWGHVLEGLVYPDGSEQWSTYPGLAPTAPDTADTGDRSTLMLGVSGVSQALELNGHVATLEDGTRSITAQLPAGLDLGTATSLSYMATPQQIGLVAGSGEPLVREIDLAEIHQVGRATNMER